jgi:DNA modification methylase
MSLGIPYYGFDANKKLEKGYTDMIRMLDPDAPVKMTFKPSETADFSKLKYDLVFTSPPYFMLEEYEGMPAYEKEQGFLDTFFVPVLKKAWAGLTVGGHMALNMPADMYEPVKKCLPRLHKTIKMPIMDRRAEEAAKGEDVAVGSREKFEYIYVWKKVAGAKFDEEKKGCGVAV